MIFSHTTSTSICSWNMDTWTDQELRDFITEHINSPSCEVDKFLQFVQSHGFDPSQSLGLPEEATEDTIVETVSQGLASKVFGRQALIRLSVMVSETFALSHKVNGSTSLESHILERPIANPGWSLTPTGVFPPSIWRYLTEQLLRSAAEQKVGFTIAKQMAINPFFGNIKLATVLMRLSKVMHRHVSEVFYQSMAVRLSGIEPIYVVEFPIPRALYNNLEYLDISFGLSRKISGQLEKSHQVTYRDFHRFCRRLRLQSLPGRGKLQRVRIQTSANFVGLPKEIRYVAHATGSSLDQASALVRSRLSKEFRDCIARLDKTFNGMERYCDIFRGWRPLTPDVHDGTSAEADKVFVYRPEIGIMNISFRRYRPGTPKYLREGRRTIGFQAHQYRDRSLSSGFALWCYGSEWLAD